MAGKLHYLPCPTHPSPALENSQHPRHVAQLKVELQQNRLEPTELHDGPASCSQRLGEGIRGAAVLEEMVDYCVTLAGKRVE